MTPQTYYQNLNALSCSSPTEKLYMMELTIPSESNLDNAHTRKHDCYASLISDLRFSSYYTRFFSLKVGSWRFLSDSNYSVLKSILPAQSSISPRRLRYDLSRLATLCSYTIFRSCSEPSWTSPLLLSIPNSIIPSKCSYDKTH